MSASQAQEIDRLIPIADVRFDSGEIEAVTDVLRSGQIRQGEVCRTFEEQFAASVDAQHGVAVSSGTAALHLAWLALLEPGDEVLVPAFTFIATASAVALAGGRPIFCDVDVKTGTLDVEDARRRITPRTRGIAPVHLFGNACDVESIQALAAEHGLRVVWDAAQAHGTRVGGRNVGSFPDLVCYSFYATKAMTTGEGGMIVTNDPALAERLRLLRSHGQERKYYHTALGLNYRLTDVQAVIGLVQLGRLPDWLRRRRRHAAILDAMLQRTPGVRIPAVRRGVEHSCHQYTIQIDQHRAGRSRDEVQQALAKLGVESAIHYPRPLHRQPVFATAYAGLRLPASEQLADTVLSLPVHEGLSDEQVAHVGRSVRAAVRGEV